MTNYIYQNKSWPDFKWDDQRIINLLGEVRNLQGRLLGRMDMLGFEYRNEAVLDTMTLDVIKSAEIEGISLDREQVRSSVARHLAIDLAGMVDSDRSVEGIVDIMIDATQNYELSLSVERLFGWHSALFPAGRSGIYKITTAAWRSDSGGPMQVVSGAIGKERVHFQAPPAIIVAHEMERFVEWFNREEHTDLILKSAVAHLWFVTIHPFSDGNGRIARALAEMLLARSDKSAQRYYSMSARIRIERREYYRILEKTQKGGLDITDWILWYLNCLMNALQSTESILAMVMYKAAFWRNNSDKILNVRQRSMLNRLLEGFEVKLTSSRWAKITKCSPDTALRDIQDLITRGILKKAEDAGGRSTNYKLV
ncbi:MAG: Fic family protein [Bacteroidales bacterium]|nr:Fic family protein [Bacteroidales bacterium]